VGVSNADRLGHRLGHQPEWQTVRRLTALVRRARTGQTTHVRL
jgi:hypothetical protein